AAAAVLLSVSFLVAGGVVLCLHRRRVHRLVGGELQRAGVHARRQLPAQLVEALADLVVEVQGVRHQEAGRQARGRQHPGEDAAWPSIRAVGVPRTGFALGSGSGARHGWNEMTGPGPRWSRSLSQPEWGAGRPFVAGPAAVHPPGRLSLLPPNTGPFLDADHRGRPAIPDRP